MWIRSIRRSIERTQNRFFPLTRHVGRQLERSAASRSTRRKISTLQRGSVKIPLHVKNQPSPWILPIRPATERVQNHLLPATTRQRRKLKHGSTAPGALSHAAAGVSGAIQVSSRIQNHSRI